MRLLLTLILSVVATVANAATVTGTIQDANGDATTVRVEFWPLTTPLQTGDALITTGRPVRTTATDGVLSVSLVEGLYQVRIGGYDKIKISVPSGSGSHEIGTLTSDGITYIPPGGGSDLTGTNDLAGTGQLLNADYISSGYLLISTNITDHDTGQLSGVSIVTTNWTLNTNWVGNYPVGLTVAGTDGTMALVGTSEGGHSTVFEHVEVDPTGTSLVDKWVWSKGKNADGGYLEMFYGDMTDPLTVATQQVYRVQPSGASVQQGQNAVMAFRDRGATTGTTVYGLGSDDNKMVFRKYANTDVDAGSTTLGNFDTNGKWWMPSLSVSNNITANNTEAFGGALISTTNRALAAATVLSPAPYGLVVNGTEGNMALVGGPEGGFSSALDFTEVAEDGSAITDKWTLAKLTSTNANGSELRFVYGPNADVGSNTNKLSIYPDGTVTIPGTLDGNGTGTITNMAGINVNSSITGDILSVYSSGFKKFSVDGKAGSGRVHIESGNTPYVKVYQSTGGSSAYYGPLGFSIVDSLNNPTVITYDSAGTLAQRNGTNAQTSRIYGTYTDASNYSRISLSHDGSGTGTIALETAGTGADDQTLRMRTTGLGAFEVFGGTVPTTARGQYAVTVSTYPDASRTASGDLSVAIGGQAPSASASRGVAIGGSYATASGQYSVAIGGTSLTSGGTFSVAIGGSSSTATGYGSAVVGGASSSAPGAYGSVFAGRYANAYLYGQHAYASGRFAANGDAQGSRLVARNTTSGTTPADLFLGGSSARLVLPANTSWGFTVSVVGRTTDAGAGVEQSGYYKFEGLIKRDGASNTTLVGSVTKTVLAEDDATWDVTVSADDTNEALDISCTGGTGDNTRWVATITLTEVGG